MYSEEYMQIAVQSLLTTLYYYPQQKQYILSVLNKSMDAELNHVGMLNECMYYPQQKRYIALVLN